MTASAVLVLVACSSAAPPSPRDAIPEPHADSGVVIGDAQALGIDSDIGEVVTGEAGSAGEAAASDVAFADVQPEAPPAAAPACALTKSWTSAGAIPSLADPTFARFGGVTPTGLTVVYTTTDGHVDVADRTDPNSDFVTLSDLIPASLQARARAAVAPSGNMVVAMAANGTDFVSWQRTSRVSAWATAPATAFDLVRTAAVQAGATISEPVLASSGLSFFYLQTTPAGTVGLLESTWNAAANQWSAGTGVNNSELSSVDSSHRRRPTGVSSDDRTLFFFDEVAGAERAAWRAAPAAPFAAFGDVAVAPEAAPDAACRLLYYEGTGADAGGANASIAR